MPDTVNVDRHELRIQEKGEGETVLFLHGAGGASWNPLLERLSADWRVLAPEHPGFGRSQTPEWMTSVGDLAFFYLDILKRLDLRNVHLVGHSLGGWLAAEIAIRSTERLRSLTLMAPAGVAVAEAPFGDIFLWSPEESARHQFYDQRLAEERIKALANADPAVQAQNKAAVARLAFSPRLHNPQLRHWLHRIDVPTLLVWGENDEIIPFACRKPFQEEIPGAELVALPRCGHAIHGEAADEASARITAFLKGAGR